MDDENDYYRRKEEKLAASNAVVSYLILALFTMFVVATIYNLITG
jgi:hypothetical protein